VKDREGRYLSINSAGARYMGRRAHEVVGKTDEELFGPDMLRQIRTYDRLVFESGEVRTDEYTEPKDGVRRTFLATKGPVRDQEGAITGLFGISRDITSRKLERLQLKARALLESKFTGLEQFGFKDPRMSRLLPLWQAVFGQLALEDQYIIALRNPLSDAPLSKRPTLAPIDAGVTCRSFRSRSSN
jgi:PAS domain S-box-containing protein